ncbi:STAS domain-containing protein [Streptomyces sp. NPDC060030]|uniref:STAS domain-containing protein n=1 Tax=Streptomyces sp. NPDC060030 TaxID=3347042 RepID=UPI0036AAA79C
MTDLPCPPFTLEVEAGPGAVRLGLVGDLDYDTSEQLVERAQACLAAEPAPQALVLDCSGLRVCDSSGVSALLQIHRDTTSRGVVLQLRNAPDFFRRTLEVTGIRHLFVLDGADDRGERERAQDGPPPAGDRYRTVPPPVPSG